MNNCTSHEVWQDDERIKWQPVVLILNGRLECSCGALAVFVTATLDHTLAASLNSNILENVQNWCQDCFIKVQEEAEDVG